MQFRALNMNQHSTDGFIMYLIKRDRIISQVMRHSASYLKRTYKFGMELPKINKEAIAINKKMGIPIGKIP